jgi:hypothetical protein
MQDIESAEARMNFPEAWRNYRRHLIVPITGSIRLAELYERLPLKGSGN